MRTFEEVENYFKYHAPDEAARKTHEGINETFMDAAEFIWYNVQPKGEGSPDKTYALRALSDARMAANMAVACYRAT